MTDLYRPLLYVPSPQVALHIPSVTHSPHSQSTGPTKSIQMILGILPHVKNNFLEATI